VIFWSGIALNAAVCIPLAILQFKLFVAIATSAKENHVRDAVGILSRLSVGLSIVSCLFLADSQRRLRNSLKQDNSFKQNSVTMMLHLVGIILSQIFLFALLQIMIVLAKHENF